MVGSALQIQYRGNSGLFKGGNGWGWFTQTNCYLNGNKMSCKLAAYSTRGRSFHVLLLSEGLGPKL